MCEWSVNQRKSDLKIALRSVQFILSLKVSNKTTEMFSECWLLFCRQTRVMTIEGQNNPGHCTHLSKGADQNPTSMQTTRTASLYGMKNASTRGKFNETRPLDPPSLITN